MKSYFPQEPAIQIHQAVLVQWDFHLDIIGMAASNTPPSWVEDLLERCVPSEPEAEPTDSMEQPGPELTEELDEDVLEPNCDTIDPDAWASESEVDNCDAERSTTLQSKYENKVLSTA